MPRKAKLVPFERNIDYSYNSGVKHRLDENIDVQFLYTEKDLYTTKYAIHIYDSFQADGAQWIHFFSVFVMFNRPDGHERVYPLWQFYLHNGWNGYDPTYIPSKWLYFANNANCESVTVHYLGNVSSLAISNASIMSYFTDSAQYVKVSPTSTPTGVSTDYSIAYDLYDWCYIWETPIVIQGSTEDPEPLGIWCCNNGGAVNWGSDKMERIMKFLRTRIRSLQRVNHPNNKVPLEVFVDSSVPAEPMKLETISPGGNQESNMNPYLQNMEDPGLSDFGVVSGYRSQIVNNIFVNIPDLAFVDNMLTSQIWDQIPQLMGKVAAIYLESWTTLVRQYSWLYLPKFTQYKNIQWDDREFAFLSSPETMNHIDRIFRRMYPGMKMLYINKFKPFQSLSERSKRMWRGLEWDSNAYKRGGQLNPFNMLVSSLLGLRGAV